VTDDEIHAEMLTRGIDTRSLEFRTTSDQLKELARDVQRIRSSPYLPKDLPVIGAVYDVVTGLIDVAVPAAS
jgi:carbonic anhydrase